MPYFFYGYDPYYWMILVPAMLIALFAQLKVSSTFNRYDRVRSARGYTGAQAAEAVLRQHGVTDVRIDRVRGRLTDHYDPRSNVIRLSDAVYASNSVAAMGVAAHEAGHAVQYAVGYGPIRLRNAIIPVCNFGSQLSILLIVIGLFLYSQPLFGLGVILFGVAVLGQVVTLPVEFNASRRALESLEGGYLLEKEGETDAELLSRTLQLAEAKLRERDRYISGLEKENALNALKLSLQAPKVRYFDEVLHSPSTYTVTQIAKELGMSGRELNRRLKALGIQFRLGGTWLLTARYQKEGYTRTHTHSWQSRCGETGTAMHTVWTEKGRLFIHCLFSSLSLF